MSASSALPQARLGHLARRFFAALGSDRGLFRLWMVLVAVAALGISPAIGDDGGNPWKPRPENAFSKEKLAARMASRAALVAEWDGEQARADKLLADNRALLAQFKKSPVQTPENPGAPVQPAITPAQPSQPADQFAKEREKIEKLIQALEELRKAVNAPKLNAGGDLTLRGVDKSKAYTLEFAADGTPVLTPTTVVTPNGPPPDPGPGPTPPPAPVLTDFGKAIKAAADKATGDSDRVNTAQGLAMLYRGISAEAHKAGTAATTETVSNTTLQVTDMALLKQGPAAVTAWANERAAMRAALVDAIQTGKTVSQMGDLLDQAAAGLEASAPKGAQAPSPAFWDFLLKLIQMLLPLLIPK